MLDTMTSDTMKDNTMIPIADPAPDIDDRNAATMRATLASPNCIKVVVSAIEAIVETNP